MKQTIDERREHHQTKEDRQRKVYRQLRARISSINAGKPLPRTYLENLATYEREAVNLERKLGL